MIYELRRYALHPGARDTLIDLFDREFVESQQEQGIRVVGQFRELDDPDRFTWIRAFPDMESRLRSLTAFYSGPAWQQHRDAANATMIDSDDVLLLRPIGAEIPEIPEIPESAQTPETPESTGIPGSPADGPQRAMITVTICLLAEPLAESLSEPLSEPLSADAERTIADRIKPLLGGADPFALFTTEPAENTFPALPVRTGEHALVWLTRFASADEHRAATTRARDLATWRAARDALGLLSDPIELRLAPTDRSLLR